MSMNTNIFSAISNSKRKKSQIFSFRITYCTKNIGVHTHLCIMNIIRSFRSKHPKSILLRHLNISFLQNKFVSVNELIRDHFDIILVSESKLDLSFPDRQFSIPSYCVA